MGHSVLLVPVPALEPYVRARWAHYEPGWVSSDSSFTHAHITVLAPFLDDPTSADLDVVRRIAEETPAFVFTGAEVATFPDGTIHLPPDPAEPFAELTARMAAAFPQCPPYGGQFAQVQPHLTLDHTAGGIDADAVRRELGALLPIRTRADRIELHWYEEGACRVLGGWDLGVRSE